MLAISKVYADQKANYIKVLLRAFYEQLHFWTEPNSDRKADGKILLARMETFFQHNFVNAVQLDDLEGMWFVSFMQLVLSLMEAIEPNKDTFAIHHG